MTTGNITYQQANSSQSCYNPYMLAYDIPQHIFYEVKQYPVKPVQDIKIVHRSIIPNTSARNPQINQ